MMPEISGRVFNIQRYSVHDGDGIRTLVFLKGCPLRCLWCANPESQGNEPQLGVIASKCSGAEACEASCVSACPQSAIRLSESGKAIIDRELCDNCGQCAEVCSSDALKLVGREMTVSEVMAEVEKDRPFYRRSGGGLTIGGGEPMLQHKFTTALLRNAQQEYLHTAIETCGLVSQEHFSEALQYVDLLHIDLKHIDAEMHRALTGQSNELILKNLRLALEIMDPDDVVVRVPVIPNHNDSIDHILACAKYVAEIGGKKIELMPYHLMGVSKYEQYGMAYQLSELRGMSQRSLQGLRLLVEGCGLQEISCGG